jgi:hypothetical protein
MVASAPWTLAIDIGTTFCVAAGRIGDGPPEIIEINGQRRVPSVVVVDEDGTMVVGQAAENLAAANPSRTVRAPKSRIGDPSPVVIGGRLYDSVDLVAALMRHLYAGAVAQHGGQAPAEVRLTHPAIWGRPRIEQLREAAGRAGLPQPVLLAEPVAAAVAYAGASGMPDGQHVAVYDLGGGTFDTAVLQATAGGFVVVGRPVGEDRLGGELFDELLANHVGQQLDPGTWEALQISDDLRWQQAAAGLRAEARRVKEALSSHPHAELMIPLPNGFVQRRVTRPELEGLIRPHIEQSVDRLQQVVADAGLRAGDLGAICLSGGASHAPLVEQAVRAAFNGVTVGRRGDPKTTVALGATAVGAVPSTDRAPLSGAGGPAGVMDGVAGPGGSGVPGLGASGAATTWGRSAPDGLPGPAPAPLAGGSGERGGSRWARRATLVPAAVVAVVIAVVAALLLTRGDPVETPLETAGAQGVEAADSTVPRAKPTTTAPARTTSTTAAVAPSSLESPAELFLGTEIRRRWDLDPASGSLAVTVTLTNAVGGTFRWHHDEPVPKSVAADASLVKTEPPAEVLQADPMFRWWYELAAGQSMTLTYRVARQPSWPAMLGAAVLPAWEAERAPLTAARQEEIVTSNQLVDRLVAPVPLGTVPSGTVPTTSPPPPPSGGGSQGPGTQVVVVTSPPATAPPAPTVSIQGNNQICAGQRSAFEGVASGAVSGVWTVSSFAISNASWSPAAPFQYVEPNASAIGGTFRATLQVVSGAGVAASATFDFAVVDCTPAPTVFIQGPTAVCAGFHSDPFTGVATDATSGTWTLPGFDLYNPSWSPGDPDQVAHPNAGATGAYTWTLTVVGPTGKTATAQHTFTIVGC